jgi:hypothetical protein
VERCQILECRVARFPWSLVGAAAAHDRVGPVVILNCMSCGHRLGNNNLRAVAQLLCWLMVIHQ